MDNSTKNTIEEIVNISQLCLVSATALAALAYPEYESIVKRQNGILDSGDYLGFGIYTACTLGLIYNGIRGLRVTKKMIREND